jgi:hypothetical protein
MTEAPRWRLISPHYLKVPELPDGTKVEWEHKETARESGRTIRKLFAVPMLLEPKDPADCNYPGEIIVATKAEIQKDLNAAMADADAQIAAKAAESEKRIAEIRAGAEQAVGEVARDTAGALVAALGGTADDAAIADAVAVRLKG